MTKTKFYSPLLCSIFLSFFTMIGFFSCTSLSNPINEEAETDSVHTADLLAERIFLLLHEIENTPALKKAMTQNGRFQQFFANKKDAVTKAVKDCKGMDCLVQAMIISEEENQRLISELSKFYHTHSFLQSFMRNNIRPTHAYSFYANYSDSALFIEAWKEQSAGINYIFHAYLQNKGLHYKSIDSARFYVYSSEYLDRIKQLVQEVYSDDMHATFFKPLLDVGIKLLQLNHRDEAVRFLPLSSFNQDAYKRIPDIQWENYPYSGILILGKGPEDSHIEISQGSKQRAKMGAELFKQEKAPLIVVSGGYVHPYMTEYCEAEEMKQFLIDSLAIPEAVIIMEPHARHTTTNLRNTNRIFLTHDIPRAKPILGVTEKRHVDYIASQRFNKVFQRDLGLIADVGLNRLSDTTFQYYPTISSFQINTMEPLDP